MELRFRKNKTHGLTRTEILVIIAVLAILAIVFWPRGAKTASRRNGRSTRTNSTRINCVNNLKQIGLSFRIWAGDNNDKYPMAVSITNRGAMELVATGDVAGCFRVMSQELNTPKILVCPADKGRVSAPSFQKDFNNSHISYFIGADANLSYPQQIMSGDDNLEVNDTPVTSGLAMIPYKRISWTADRHGWAGNILYADGSVLECSTAGLLSAAKLSATPAGTDRLAIP